MIKNKVNETMNEPDIGYIKYSYCLFSVITFRYRNSGRFWLIDCRKHTCH